jgi:hypothetical protein
MAYRTLLTSGYFVKALLVKGGLFIFAFIYHVKIAIITI